MSRESFESNGTEKPTGLSRRSSALGRTLGATMLNTTLSRTLRPHTTEITLARFDQCERQVCTQSGSELLKQKLTQFFENDFESQEQLENILARLSQIDFTGKTMRHVSHWVAYCLDPDSAQSGNYPLLRYYQLFDDALAREFNTLPIPTDIKTYIQEFISAYANFLNDPSDKKYNPSIDYCDGVIAYKCEYKIAMTEPGIDAVFPDFSYLDLSGIDFSPLKTFESVAFDEANLTDCVFKECCFRFCNFRNTDLQHADFLNACAVGMDSKTYQEKEFSQATLTIYLIEKGARHVPPSCVPKSQPPAKTDNASFGPSNFSGTAAFFSAAITPPQSPAKPTPPVGFLPGL